MTTPCKRDVAMQNLLCVTSSDIVNHQGGQELHPHCVHYDSETNEHRYTLQMGTPLHDHITFAWGGHGKIIWVVMKCFTKPASTNIINAPTSQTRTYPPTSQTQKNTFNCVAPRPLGPAAGDLAVGYLQPPLSPLRLLRALPLRRASRHLPIKF